MHHVKQKQYTEFHSSFFDSPFVLLLILSRQFLEGSLVTNENNGNPGFKALKT